MEPTSANGWLREFRRTPDRERDGTATWWRTTVQRALRQAPDGLPTSSSTSVPGQILHDAGYSWQHGRTWRQTSEVKRKRGTVAVTDPDAEAKQR
jgi:hypothetical protein